MQHSVLKKLGFSEKEAEVYLTLLKYGTQPTSLVAKRAKLNRGTTFLTLKELVAKGMVTKIMKNNVQYHSALSPKYLSSLVGRKKEELVEIEAELGEAIPFLESLQNPLSPTPRRPLLGEPRYLLVPPRRRRRGRSPRAKLAKLTGIPFTLLAG